MTGWTPQGERNRKNVEQEARPCQGPKSGVGSNTHDLRLLYLLSLLYLLIGSDLEPQLMTMHTPHAFGKENKNATENFGTSGAKGERKKRQHSSTTWHREEGQHSTHTLPSSEAYHK